MSSTSSSWRRLVAAALARKPAGAVRATLTWPSARSTRPGCDGPTTAGARRTSRGCSASSGSRSWSSSRARTWSCPAPPPRWPAWPAAPSSRTTGWRSAARPRCCSAGSGRRRACAACCRARAPAPSRPRLHRLARGEAIQAGERPALGVDLAVLVQDGDERQACGAGRSRSRWGRGPGVTFTAPVPNLGSTSTASAMIGISPVEERVLHASCRSWPGGADRRGARRPRCRPAWSRAGWWPPPARREPSASG